MFLKIQFGYKFQKNRFKTKENYVVLSNHTTDFDMLFVASSFKEPMYFVGSEHIARWKLLYAFLKVCFDPIMRNKGASAASAVKEIKRRLKNGANICFFPEGVRSWDGETAPISFSTAKLVKSSGCGLITYKITGGYFASPMWSGASIRRGKVFGSPVRYFSAEEISSLSAEEIYDIIIKDLYEDAYKRQQTEMERYRGNALADGLPRLMFICPECKKRDSFVSDGNRVECSACGCAFTYNEFGFLEGKSFKTLKEFSDWQKAEVQSDVIGGVEYTAEAVSFLSLKNHEGTQLPGGRVCMSPDALKIGERVFSTSDISDLAMCGNRKIVFTHGKDYYELITDNNAFKFMIYYNLNKGGHT